jgi:hypothetical protein
MQLGNCTNSRDVRLSQCKSWKPLFLGFREEARRHRIERKKVFSKRKTRNGKT